jgi:GT2 family glycosyltransferase
MSSATAANGAYEGSDTDALAPPTIDLSIVIVTWNNAGIISDCLRSLKSFDADPEVEIIVVDNASGDGTPDLIEHEFSYVRLVRQDRNCGFAGGNNTGIRLSRGRYLCLVNSDVVIPTGCVEKLLRYIQDQPDIGMLGPKMILSNGSVGRSCLQFPTVVGWLWRALALDDMFKHSQRFGAYLMTYFQYDRTIDVDILTGWFWILRRQAIDEVGLLDEGFFMYGEDMDWCKRFKNAGWRTVFYSDAAAFHHCGASSSKAPSRLYVEKTRAGLKYCRRHHSRFALIGFWFVASLHELVRIAGYSVVLVFSPARSDSTLKIQRSVACLRWLLWHRAMPASESAGSS